MPEQAYQTQVLPADDPDAIKLAASLLSRGEVIAFPTDTVYGLGSTVWQVEAVERLYLVKQRPHNMAIPLLVADQAQALRIAQDKPAAFQNLACEFWPGELTLIVHRQATIPDIVTAGGDTVALRMPNNPCALRLCRDAGGALAVTSANRSGQPAGVTADEVFLDLAGLIPLVLDGGHCPGGVASTIVDCTRQPARILRLGNISLEILRAVVPDIVLG